MAKQLRKRGERKNENSRKMRDLPAKSLGACKAAAVKGGTSDIPISKDVDKSSAK